MVGKGEVAMMIREGLWRREEQMSVGDLTNSTVHVYSIGHVDLTMYTQVLRCRCVTKSQICAIRSSLIP